MVDADRRTGDAPEAYNLVSGDFTVVVIRWRVDPLEGLRALAAHGAVNGYIDEEIDRLVNPVTPPKEWSYLWFLGPGEVYRSFEREGRAGAICCRTHRDTGLHHQGCAARLRAWHAAALVLEGRQAAVEIGRG